MPSFTSAAVLAVLAGLEIDVRHLPRDVLAVSSAAFALSFVIALGVGLLLESAGLVRSAWLVAITLSATSLGVVLPVLEDAGQLTTPAGRLVLAGSSLAEVVPVVLLSVLFAGRSTALGPKLLLLALFLVLVAALLGALVGVGRRHLLLVADRDEAMTHSLLPVKIKAVGHGSSRPSSSSPPACRSTCAR